MTTRTAVNADCRYLLRLVCRVRSGQHDSYPGVGVVSNHDSSSGGDGAGNPHYMTKDEMIHMMREFGETVAHSIADQFQEVMLSEMQVLMIKHDLDLDVIEDIMPIMFSAYAMGIHDASEHAMDASRMAMRLIENEEEIDE